MIKYGIDVLKAQQFAPLQGKRVGLLTNLSATTNDLTPSYLLMANSPYVNLVALFAPEHGILGAEPGGAKIDSSIDPATDVPVYSLYGENFRPMREMMQAIDIFVCDIQDIGVRYYTYLWTLTHIIDACSEFGVPVLVCDRPNPLRGNRVAGAPLDSRFASIRGRYNIPMQHGMTIGELAVMLNQYYNARPAQVTVVPCEGLTRDMGYWEFGTQWVPPSPSTSHFISVEHYPGACLVEGTIFSEGRGTALPFEVMGAPFINAMIFADYLNMQELVGVRFRPYTFKPTASKFMGELCYGVQVHVFDIHRYDPIRTWLTVLCELKRVYPEQFAWIPPTGKHYHIDLLAGSDMMRHQIDAGVSADEIMQGWDAYCAEFLEKRKPFLIYE